MQRAGFRWHGLLGRVREGRSCQGALQRSSARSLPQTACTGFARRDTRHAQGPFSNPAVVASLVGNFHVPQVREQLLRGACYLPLPVQLKVTGVCSSFPLRELCWPGMPVLLPPPEVFRTYATSTGPQSLTQV